MRMRLALCLALLAAPSAFAGLAYKVSRSGTMYEVSSEDGSLRVTKTDPTDGPVLWDGIVGTKASGMYALNSQNQTWYAFGDDPSPFAIASRYLNPDPQATVKKATMTFAEASPHHYTIQLSYDAFVSYGGERVKVTCTAAYDVVTTDAYDRRFWPGRVLGSLPYPAANEKLTTAEAGIHGFPLHVSLHATRAYPGGKPQSEDMTVEVTGIHEATFPPATFVRPAGYRYQEPVIGAPGGGPR